MAPLSGQADDGLDLARHQGILAGAFLSSEYLSKDLSFPKDSVIPSTKTVKEVIIGLRTLDSCSEISSKSRLCACLDKRTIDIMCYVQARG